MAQVVGKENAKLEKWRRKGAARYQGRARDRPKLRQGKASNVILSILSGVGSFQQRLAKIGEKSRLNDFLQRTFRSLNRYPPQ